VSGPRRTGGDLLVEKSNLSNLEYLATRRPLCAPRGVKITCGYDSFSATARAQRCAQGGMRAGRRVRIVSVSSVSSGAGRRSRSPAEGGGVAADGKRVRVALTAEQVDEVVRTAAAGGNLSLLLSGLGDVRAAFGAPLGQLEDPRLSGSLLCGLMILASFPADGGFMSIKDISLLTGKSPSTAHRYISTLVAVGLLERDPRTRAYRLAGGRAAGSGADAG
jgi:hypothetical protein